MVYSTDFNTTTYDGVYAAVDYWRTAATGVSNPNDSLICDEFYKFSYNNFDYWWPWNSNGYCSFPKQDGIFVHPKISTEDTFIQSFTIDTNNLDSNSTDKPLAFFVSSYSGGPIANFKYDKVTVEVYTYHEDQIPLYSVYKPTYTYEIKGAANTSDSPIAKYWHVFNIMKVSQNSNDYAIVDIPTYNIVNGEKKLTGFYDNGSIENSFTEVLQKYSVWRSYEFSFRMGKTKSLTP